MSIIRGFAILSVFAACTSAWTLPSPPRALSQPLSKALVTAGTIATIALSTPLIADASTTAGQIRLNSVPPTSIDVQISDLPVVGKLLSGTYTKVADNSIANPSVTITSPKDKVSAVKAVATTGHLEFDISGLIGTHLDVDLAADQAGVATVRVTSPLIPKLPFKNTASSGKTGKPSNWVKVTNMGNGETYFFNEKTQVSQFDEPSKI